MPHQKIFCFCPVCTFAFAKSHLRIGHPFSHGRATERLHLYDATFPRFAAYWCKLVVTNKGMFLCIVRCTIPQNIQGQQTVVQSRYTSPSQPGLLCQITFGTIAPMILSLLCRTSNQKGLTVQFVQLSAVSFKSADRLGRCDALDQGLLPTRCIACRFRYTN